MAYELVWNDFGDAIHLAWDGGAKLCAKASRRSNIALVDPHFHREPMRDGIPRNICEECRGLYETYPNGPLRPLY